MYKKYVRLKLNESKKTICRIRYDEYGSQVEVKLFSEEEVLDLSGYRVKVCAELRRMGKVFLIDVKLFQIE